MAEEVLGLHLYGMEKDKETLPKRTDKIPKINTGDIVVAVSVFPAIVKDEMELKSANMVDSQGTQDNSLNYLQTTTPLPWKVDFNEPINKGYPILWWQGIYSNSITNYAMSKISIYPNPTTGELTIDNGELTIESVEIYNIVGQKLLSIESLQSQEQTIDVSHLAQGMYYLKIAEKVVKFVKF